MTIHKRIGALVIGLLCCSSLMAQVDNTQTVDFGLEIQPIIESACLNCHNTRKAEGNLRLDSLEAAIRGGDSGPAVVVGKPEESALYTLTALTAGHDDIMPPNRPLSKVQTERLRKWILEGACWSESKELQVRPRIDFVKHIQPILEQNCLSCHSRTNPEAGYNLSTRKEAFKSGFDAPYIVRFRPHASLLYTLAIVEKDADELMPPANAGGPLAADAIETLRLWISQGAVWPTDLTLKPQSRIENRTDTPDNFALVQRIHAFIVQHSDDDAEPAMTDYHATIPLTGAEYNMVAIKGGGFWMGSPDDELHRQKNEGPRTKVQVDPFWIGKCEVTWDEYEPFMVTQVDRQKNGSRIDYDPQSHTMIDAVSQPTKPYMEMSFGMGQKGYPAISMTQHAANKYCQWLSAQTGHFYRLPTEAEWEYACRAGTTTAYSFGDDAAKIGDYAWYYENSNEKYQKVGLKKPNPWGLHDMHGNVMEWTADRFVPDYLAQVQESATNPYIKPEKLYPRTVRGGGWDDDPEQLRSALRRGSNVVWKQQDPQLPKSIWYHTDAQWLGFRIVRPKKVPTPEEMYFFWNSATNKM